MIKVNLSRHLLELEKEIRSDDSMNDIHLNQIVIIYDETADSIETLIRSTNKRFFDCSVSFPSII